MLNGLLVTLSLLVSFHCLAIQQIKLPIDKSAGLTWTGGEANFYSENQFVTAFESYFR